jgi:hypothetical protein
LSFNGNLQPSSDEGTDLTTKGDIHGYSTENTRVAVGSNGTVLTADSTNSNGIAWASSAGSVLTTQGDILYHNASGLARLAAGTSGNVLQTQGAGADPTWAASSGGQWEKLEYTTGGGSGTLNTGTFTTKDYLKIIFWSPKGSGTRATQIKVGAAGTISSSGYTYQRWNKSTYESSTSGSAILLQPDTTVDSTFWSVIDVINLDGEPKSFVANSSLYDVGACGTSGGGWSTTSQINIVQMDCQTHGGTDSSVPADSIIEVWGCDKDK